MLKLSLALYQKIEACAAAAYPYEGCGLLLGEMASAGNIAHAIFSVPNRWAVESEKRERFLIAPEDMFHAELAALAQGLDLVGVFHSHPDCPPIASPRDLAWTAWTGYSYLITQVNGSVPALSRSWQLLLDRSGFIEEEIVIIESPAPNLF